MPHYLKRLAVISLCLFAHVTAAGKSNSKVIPDLTKGEKPTDKVKINLGPTGLQGWVYRIGSNTEKSRQILVQTVEDGSPGAGKMKVNDIILGASGGGKKPKPFQIDARRGLANAIADAEASNPASLSFLVFRSGKTGVVNIPLQTLGAYSATAPYQCPKSAKILELGLDHAYAHGDAGYAGTSALVFLAANDPKNPKNKARQLKAREHIREAILSKEKISELTSDHFNPNSNKAWDYGFRLIVLAEYYLITGDKEVIPSIKACANLITTRHSVLGAVGHKFSSLRRDEATSKHFMGGYTMNASTLPTAIGLILAKRCDLEIEGLDGGIARVKRTIEAVTGLGTFNYYVASLPLLTNENNGKSAQAALALAIHGGESEAAKYFAKCAGGSAKQWEDGHIMNYFNTLWCTLGANVGGQKNAASFFSRIGWKLDLARHWDGGFEYERYNCEKTESTPKCSGRLWMSTAALLTYALPMAQLEITGSSFAADPALKISDKEQAEVDQSDFYQNVVSERSNDELFSDLTSFSAQTTSLAAQELAKRKADIPNLNEKLIAMATKNGDPGQVGACRALGKMNSTAAVPTLIGLLESPDRLVRFASADALAQWPNSGLKPQVNDLLKAFVNRGIPPLGEYDDEDPFQYAQARLLFAIFGGNGCSAAMNGDFDAVDRQLLHSALMLITRHPSSDEQLRMNRLFRNLKPEDMSGLADVLIAGVTMESPTSAYQGDDLGTIHKLLKYRWAEGIPLAIKAIENGERSKGFISLLGEYGGSARLVYPSANVEGFLKQMISNGQQTAEATAALKKILADKNAVVPQSFKSIDSVTALPASLKLPKKSTIIAKAIGRDLGNPDAVFTWKKLHGAGKVSFDPNGTAESHTTTINIEPIPGRYTFAVTLSDPHGLTQVTENLKFTVYPASGKLSKNKSPMTRPVRLDVTHGVAKPFTVLAKDPEAHPLTYRILRAPQHGILTGEAPKFTYTAALGYAGSDAIHYEVMDSEGQTSQGKVTISVSSPAQPTALALYEPFNYQPGKYPQNMEVSPKSNGFKSIGFVGPWEIQNTNRAHTIEPTSVAFSSVPTLGGRLINGLSGSRKINQEMFKKHGLLDDGNSLWFSVLFGYDKTGRRNNWSLALANGKFAWNKNALSDGDLAFGVYCKRSVSRVLGFEARAVQFKGKSNDPTTSYMKYGSYLNGRSYPQDSPEMIIGKFTWGSEKDTLELYQPDSLLFIDKPFSTLEFNADQSRLDQLSFSQTSWLDEIRFGPSYQSVIIGNVPLK